MNEIITVKQLPIIEEQLAAIKSEIQTSVDTALAMVCTEDSVKEIKAVRANLNKQFNELESKRKAVKSAVMSPYEQFESIYKTCVTDLFKPADRALKAKIDEVEDNLKAEKIREVVTHFVGYHKELGIFPMTFERSGITVTLSASVKSLKEKATEFLDKVADELALIETQEHKAEILVEYKQSLNVAQAMTIVANRVKAVEEEQARIEEERLESEALEAEEVRRGVPMPIEVEPVVEPVEAPEEPTEQVTEEILTISFTVKATRTRLIAVRDFLKAGGYEYE